MLQTIVRIIRMIDNNLQVEFSAASGGGGGDSQYRVEFGVWSNFSPSIPPLSDFNGFCLFLG
jgi:hypothetical protein